MIVDEPTLEEMRAAGKADDACLVYLIKTGDPDELNELQSPLTAATDAEINVEPIKFKHAHGVFHQNFMTKNMTQK